MADTPEQARTREVHQLLSASFRDYFVRRAAELGITDAESWPTIRMMRYYDEHSELFNWNPAAPPS